MAKSKISNIFRDHFISLEQNVFKVQYTCVIRLHNTFNDRVVKKWLPNMIQTTFYKSSNTIPLDIY